MDLRIIPQEAIDALEQQTHRRFVKTHLPVDALVFSPKAKYLYIGRDGRDVAWSQYNHNARATPAYYELFNSLPGRDGPPMGPPTGTVHDFWREWFEGDGMPDVAVLGERPQAGGRSGTCQTSSSSTSTT